MAAEQKELSDSSQKMEHIVDLRSNSVTSVHRIDHAVSIKYTSN